MFYGMIHETSKYFDCPAKILGFPIQIFTDEKDDIKKYTEICKQDAVVIKKEEKAIKQKCVEYAISLIKHNQDKPKEVSITFNDLLNSESFYNPKQKVYVILFEVTKNKKELGVKLDIEFTIDIKVKDNKVKTSFEAAMD